MLNCTDLECILHNHHYHAHLLQLQQHLLPDDSLSTVADGRDRGKSLEDNNTNSLQSLSHLDPPIDPGYMICGVVIAMALVGVIIIVLAVTISKLRKREDHHSEHPEQTVVQTATDNNLSNNNQTVLPESIIPPDSNHAYTNNAYTATTTSEQFVWQFPPPYPPPRINPSQYALYNEQVHGLSTDRPGFVKGFRKNLGGRWRRLVKRKPEMESCAIPPELKDQLKTIYVY